MFGTINRSLIGKISKQSRTKVKLSRPQNAMRTVKGIFFSFFSIGSFNTEQSKTPKVLNTGTKNYVL